MQRSAKDKDRLKAVNASEDSLVTTQLKIMDIAPPLIDLYTRVLSLGKDEKKSIATESLLAVLQQWARTYHNITKKRRRAVVYLIEPSFDFLSADPEAFAAGRDRPCDKFLGEPIFQNDEFTYRTLTLFGN
jgi:hypothetical protein